MTSHRDDVKLLQLQQFRLRGIKVHRIVMASSLNYYAIAVNHD